MLEGDVYIGDRIRIGTAEFEVTQPRQPCFKLGIRLGREDIVQRARSSVSVADIFAMRMGKDASRELLRRAASLEWLTPSWRQHFLGRVS
jgi:MOSC domain-containing protein YiiM